MTEKTTIDKSIPLYFRSGFVLTFLFVIGPLALPLVWFSPALSTWVKVVMTVVMVGITWMTYQTWLEMAPMVTQMMGTLS